ncbi:MAG: TetR/AcrR family transcriptional regulator, partial [Candidatus Borkfalkiaceae bacterium]|nr:TetR/AcrR family transcriptional regulator [Christensenellaceae bacterium]
MDKGNTKREIITAALDLFSTQGFEATSISQIADAVGIRKASLYSHFESKQAILDALILQVLEGYAKQSLFAKPKRQVGDAACPMPCDEVVSQVKSQIYYILHDPFISKARKMLTIEQFRNPELAALQTKQN